MAFTNRGAALVLALTASAVYLAGTVATDTPSDVIPARQETCKGVEIYEDGSGVQYDRECQEIRTFPNGTFVWPAP